jgi:hypothetical protein
MDTCTIKVPHTKVTESAHVSNIYTHPGAGGLPIIWLKGAASSSEVIEGVSFISIVVTDSRVVSYKIGTAATVIERWAGAYGTYGLIGQMANSGFTAPTLVASGATPTGTLTGVGIGDTTSSTASTTTGGATLPALAAGYLEINIGGTIRKIPYYAT